MLAKQMAIECEMKGANTDPLPENVDISGKLKAEDLPRKIVYPRGTARNHTDPPRPLHPSEY